LKEEQDEELDETVRQSYREVDGMETLEKVQLLDELVEDAKEDPELKSALIEKLRD
jgi:hypothetical protein